jgi:hypothetical protein
MKVISFKTNLFIWFSHFQTQRLRSYLWFIFPMFDSNLVKKTSSTLVGTCIYFFYLLIKESMSTYFHFKNIMSTYYPNEYGYIRLSRCSMNTYMYELMTLQSNLSAIDVSIGRRSYRGSIWLKSLLMTRKCSQDAITKVLSNCTNRHTVHEKSIKWYYNRGKKYQMRKIYVILKSIRWYTIWNKKEGIKWY